jgi:osmotically-inducible protein OsmY
VNTPEQRIRAEQLAWDVHGARQIVNNIQVQRPPVAAAPSASVATPAGSR